MIYHKNLICITFVLMFAFGVFGSLIQWSNVETKQLSTVFEDSNVQIEDCGSEDDILEINEIKVVPATIVPGKEFTIEATGKLREVIQDGAFVDVVIKLGLINILRKQYDLCDTIAKKEGNEIRCPIPADDIKISQNFTLPREIPRARLTILIRAFSADEQDVGCLNAKVDFQSHALSDASSITVNNYYYN